MALREGLERIGAVFVLRRDGAALLQHRDDKPGLRHAGMWVPPGGHADEGETMVDCARRELAEETGYNARDLEFVSSFTLDAAGWAPVSLSVFWCWYDGVQAVRCLEGQALKFIERSAAGAYAIPASLLEAWDAALAAARQNG